MYRVRPYFEPRDRGKSFATIDAAFDEAKKASKADGITRTIILDGRARAFAKDGRLHSIRTCTYCQGTLTKMGGYPCHSCDEGAWIGKESQ